MKKTNKLLNLTLITGLALSPLSVSALQKTENVYSNLNYDGSSYKTVVSNHLSWIEEGDIEDDSELKDILNINGEEKFTQTQNKLSWKSLGKDIFYQGKTEKQQPIKTEIKYYLNEEEQNPEEILGKSGQVKIEFNFQNELKNIVRINGRNTEIYTPFVTTIGTMLDSQNNKNIKITNGKVIGTGSRSMIVGLSSPGLYESMGLNELKDLNKITLTYETTNFSLNSIYIVSTPKLLEETDLKIFDKMDALYNDMQELQKNMDKLEAGISELEKGSSSLKVGSQDLVKGLKSAVSAVTQLKDGSVSLNNGLNQIVTSLETVEKELNKMNLQNSLNSLLTLKAQNTNTITALVQKTNMSIEELTNLYTQNNLVNYTGDNQTLLSIKSTYELIYLLQMNNEAINTTITTLKGLNEKVNALLPTLKNALQQSATGANQLSNGLKELQSGINKLYNGGVSLEKGTTQLYQGANTLNKGANEFNSKGINKLNNYVKTLHNYSNKLEALIKLSEDYKGFTSNNSNSTNFIGVIKPAKITYKK